MTEQEILAGESETLEFKRDIPDQSTKYMKTVVAFANAVCHRSYLALLGSYPIQPNPVFLKKSRIY